jgi:phage major head subunit gpT-like protein
MTLNPRQPRPLVRDAESLRDDRLFIVAFDDTFAPKQYFDFYRFPRIKIHVVQTLDGTSAAPHVLDRLLQIDHETDDELWMLLDTTTAPKVRTSQASRKPWLKPGVRA